MSAGRRINSQNQNWGTPPKYISAIKDFFGGDIDLDPCSNQHSVVYAKTEYCLPFHDGLRESWNFRRIFVNPPYGADRDRGTRIIHWLSRCADAHRRFSSEVLALVPVASNTLHWKRYVFPQATAIAFLYDTRLKFLVDGSDGGKGAPMSCAIVYWGVKFELFRENFAKFGAVIDLGPIDERMLADMPHRALKERVTSKGVVGPLFNWT